MRILGWLGLLLSVGCSSFDNSTFHYNVPEKHQPNCVVGAFCMYSYEALNIKTSPLYWQTNELTKFNGNGVVMEDIIPAWNRVFQTNHLKIIYDREHLTEYSNQIFLYNKPYMWIGKHNGGYHACLIYFNTNSVIYKHFIYNQWTNTNYMVMTNYNSFIKDTEQVYDVP